MEGREVLQAKRILVLSDIHGNLEALEAVLWDAPTYDAVICLGDTVGYGASPNECVELVRSLPLLTGLVGNHDLAALGRLDLGLFNDHAAEAAAWTARSLTTESTIWLGSLSPSTSAAGAYLAHASPREPVWEYMEEAWQGPPNFAAFEEELCFVGHTHVPRVFRVRAGQRKNTVLRVAPGEVESLTDGTRRIINPGSVGQPRDGDPRAAYGLLDAVDGWFRFLRAAYDVRGAQRKIREAGLPEVLAVRLEYGR